ncbi:bifunctional DNA primase/polymerase [Streptomyces sp. NPDC021608]|uniref:bifunctional DNA primase/polymerase n=1 Tax=Streptomyces sp. NPDC021608 TaxID=3154903 RepID=UPI0033C656D4
MRARRPRRPGHRPHPAPSDGEYLYFTDPTGVRPFNTAETVSELTDTRAWGGYVVAAGSTTPTGPYEPLCGSAAAPLADGCSVSSRRLPRPLSPPRGLHPGNRGDTRM